MYSLLMFNIDSATVKASSFLVVLSLLGLASARLSAEDDRRSLFEPSMAVVNDRVVPLPTEDRLYPTAAETVIVADRLITVTPVVKTWKCKPFEPLQNDSVQLVSRCGWY